MKNITFRHKKIRMTYIAVSAITCFILAMVCPWFSGIYGQASADNYYKAYINGEYIGAADDEDVIKQAMVEARSRLNAESQSPQYVETELLIKNQKRVSGSYDSNSKLAESIYELMKSQTRQMKDKAYVLDINGFTITLESLEEVEALLQSAKSKYDSNNEYTTSLEVNNENGFKTITCILSRVQNADIKANDVHNVANIAFEQDIEIVESYVDPTQISELESAIHMISNEEESESQAELSIIVDSNIVYDEFYSLDTQYINNDQMYNNEQKILNEGSNGVKRFSADVRYKNGKEISRNIVKEEIITEAVAKVIEVGTVEPPTFIKPLKGGYISSYFEKRWGSFHKGIDWACNTGTSILASRTGTVVTAGWVNGYGYCVELAHADGTHTRYGHLSEFHVNVGQNVKQGDLIALSGNTGNSTGPHLHFEVIINGVQVNPLEYLK